MKTFFTRIEDLLPYLLLLLAFLFVFKDLSAQEQKAKNGAERDLWDHQMKTCMSSGADPVTCIHALRDR